jgi:NADH:ubiquinone oxidoreductase subunit 5 (subunit L)/multisubunit Na+/H+ antiporter MnhA subunit
MSVSNLYILIIFLPFYSAFIVGFFGRLIGRRGSIFVSVGHLIVATGLS